MEVGVPQRSPLRPFMLNCGENREQVEETLERWSYALERNEMKVRKSKMENG